MTRISFPILINKLIPGLIFIFVLSCKSQENVPIKENPPTVFTKPASDVSLFSATLNGEVTEEGFTAATDRGFVYSDKNTNPSVSDTKVQSGYGKGVYLVKVDKLALNTKYYFKAYSTNTKGTAYGEVQSFTTADYSLSTLTTEVPKNITFYSVEVGGNVAKEGGGSVSERGFCFGLNPSPSITDNKLPVSTKGLGSFSLVIINLKENTKYYIRSYAINEKGTAYGNEQNFNTLKITNPTTKIEKIIFGYTDAYITSSIIQDGGTQIKEWGIVLNMNGQPTIQDKIGGTSLDYMVIKYFSTHTPVLNPGTKYFVRAYVTSSNGQINYGDEQSFTTLKYSINNKPTEIVEIQTKTGRIWMDRNLGALKVASNLQDVDSFGDLFQWGRNADGHEKINSPITKNQSSNDLVGNNYFIATNNSDWRVPSNDNLWQGVNGVNNVCPTGFRIPTFAEWEKEISTWEIKTPIGAINSNLKLPMAGQRVALFDAIRNDIVSSISPHSSGYYWASSNLKFGNKDASAALVLVLDPGLKAPENNVVYIGQANRGLGASVRCIKD